MDAQIWVLQDQTSPEQKIWGLILVDDGTAFTFYGGTVTPRLVLSKVERHKGLAALTGKKKKYPKGWYEKVGIPEWVAPLDFCKDVYRIFFNVGSPDVNVSAFLQKYRSKAPDRQVSAARERANNRINAAIQKVPTLPWAF